MNITELLNVESIGLGEVAADKEEAIDKLVSLMEQGGHLKDKHGYKAGILARESLGSTAVGDGIAIPHAKVAAVKEPGLAAITVPGGVDYEAFDGSLANLIFMIAAPEGEADTHLEALATLSALLMKPGFKEGLLQAESKEAFLQVIDDAEKAQIEKKEAKAASAAKTASTIGAAGVTSAVNAADTDGSTQASGGYQVLAVTACPTGIAHTFMAAENLENTGAKLGIPVKAETNGSAGAENVLTAAEIAAADCIIIAADKNVETARFDGKPVIQTSVSEGIHHAEALIKKAVSGTVNVYHHIGGSNAGQQESGASDSVGRSIYKHLMNGVSHMLPFVIGGGILIALAFLFDNYEIDPSNFGKNTPLAAYLKTIGEQAFGMMLPVLAGFIAMSIADRPSLAVGFVGGLVAKMGLSFISEGAIPFAAQDPLRVIPSCIAGSAIAGGLSMFFGCTLRAPHGGIFVLPTVGNPFGYLMAILIGSAIGCIILAALKKNLEE